jgi:hypothetical protein
MIDAVFHMRRSGDGSVFCIEVGRLIHNEFWNCINDLGKKTNDHFRIQITRPVRMISRGFRGQMERWWGHCSDIAEQLSQPGRLYTKERVSDSLKLLAVKEHFPVMYNDITNQVEPKGLADCTAEDYQILEMVKQRFADQHELWLTEYHEVKDPGGNVTELIPYKSIQGRTMTQMEVYWRERTRTT